MTRQEAIAKLIASGKYDEASANKKLDEIAAAKAAKGAPAPVAKEAPARQKVAAKAPAPQKVTPAKAKAEPEDVTEVGTYAPPAPYGLGGARHRMEDREDAQFVTRNSYFGKPESAEDLALAIGNRAADDYAKREQVRGSLYNEMTRLGDARRVAIDAQAEARRDPLAEEIAGAAKAKADQARAAEMTRRSIDLMKNGPKATGPKGDTYDLTGPTITQNGKPLVAKGKSAKQRLIDAGVDPAKVASYTEEDAQILAEDRGL